VPAEIVEPKEDWDLNELSPRDKTIRNFAYFVFGLVALITLVILLDWFLKGPAAPALSNNTTAEGQKAILDNLRLLNGLAEDRAKNMFDLMIVKALLPVFATIIGVFLGTRTTERTE